MNVSHDVFKYRLEIFCIILSFVIPFFVGLPEVFLLIGAALAGKKAVQALAAKVRAWFGMDKPSAPVGYMRYNIGLVLFFGGMLANWILAYTGPGFVQALGKNPYWVTTFILDLMTITGFFVAGSLFWEKIKKLFMWEEEINY